MKYRREIDGLRSVAVLPVILFHAGFSFFSGGFVGVDVFFVISGYLITSIIIEDIRADRFSIVSFYERRARRILPALFVVVALCLPVAWAWMLPVPFRDFTQSVAAIGLFASNVLFWLEADYFATDAEEKPLLHTWSLAVEEQYYIFFPILLFFAYRRRKTAVLWLMLGLAALSLGLSEIGARHWPVGNFYLIPTRAWELFAGSICALLIRDFGLERRSDVLSLAGLGLILASILLFDATTPFPSLYALAPVGGAMLIILFGGAGTLTARLLSAPPLVGIGLISYSAYLWHQPLFAFARVRSLDHPDAWLMSLLALASLVLAYPTWRFVEQPFRGRRAALLPTRGGIFAASAAGVAACVAVGAAGQLGQGFPNRLSPETVAAATVRKGDASGCLNRFSPTDIRDGARCVIGAEGVAPTLAVMGDSHAGAITDALSAALAAEGRSAVMVSGSWCAPLMAFGSDNPFKNPVCRARMDAAYAQILDDFTIETVILVAQWANYTTGYRWNDRQVAAYRFGDGTATEPADNPAMFEAALRHTLEAIRAAGKGVLVVGPLPEYPLNVPRVLGKAIHFGSSQESLLLGRDAYRARNAEVLDAFAVLESFGNAVLLDPVLAFCSADACSPVGTDGAALYADDNHLSSAGGAILSARIMAALRETDE